MVTNDLRFPNPVLLTRASAERPPKGLMRHTVPVFDDEEPITQTLKMVSKKFPSSATSALTPVHGPVQLNLYTSKAWPDPKLLKIITWLPTCLFALLSAWLSAARGGD